MAPDVRALPPAVAGFTNHTSDMVEVHGFGPMSIGQSGMKPVQQPPMPGPCDLRRPAAETTGTLCVG
jgi:hypothetical protein